MFIKKDLRKIPEILADAKGKENNNNNDALLLLLEDLQLSRRKAEFQGSVRTLCQPSNAPSLMKLKFLSLYDCNISDLTGIGMLSNLTSLSLGRNPGLTTIPDEFADLQQLQELCLDDCAIGQKEEKSKGGGKGGVAATAAAVASASSSFPEPLLELKNLRELRLSKNQIESLPDNFGNRLCALRILGLDHNRLSSLPDSMENLTHLTTLLVRHNQLTALPKRFPGSSMTHLKLLHISSNQLTTLPDCIVDCSSLTHVYANGNALVNIPMGIELLYNLKHLNLAHNQLNDDDDDDDDVTCRQRLVDLYDLFGKPNEDGNCVDKEGVKVMLRGNPALIKDKKKKNKISPTKKDDDNKHDKDVDDDDDELSATDLDMDIS